MRSQAEPAPLVWEPHFENHRCEPRYGWTCEAGFHHVVAETKVSVLPLLPLRPSGQHRSLMLAAWSRGDAGRVVTGRCRLSSVLRSLG